MALSHSRDPLCCCTTSPDLATFFDCHRQACAHFGGYLEQIAGTLRPGTVRNAELTLRESGLLVAAEDTTVTCVGELKRRHVERYRQWLWERPATDGGPLHGTPSATG